MQNQKRIILNDSQSKLVIDPMVGGALVNFDFKGPQGWIPILRPGNLFQRSGPFSLGCNVLLPFANRIPGDWWEAATGFKDSCQSGRPITLSTNLQSLSWHRFCLCWASQLYRWCPKQCWKAWYGLSTMSGKRWKPLGHLFDQTSRTVDQNRSLLGMLSLYE